MPVVLNGARYNEESREWPEIGSGSATTGMTSNRCLPRVKITILRDVGTFFPLSQADLAVGKGGISDIRLNYRLFVILGSFRAYFR